MKREAANAWTGILKQQDILEELVDFFKGRKWSPTAFECYAACPFKFFLKRVLQLYPLMVPEEEVERTDEGIIIHTVLERFFTMRKEEGCLPLSGSDEEKGLIHTVAGEVYEQWEEKGIVGNRDLWEIQKKRLDPLWDLFIEEEARFRDDGLVPTFFEFTIGADPGGKPSDMAPLSFRDTDGNIITVVGKIDRIDIGTGKVRIIDYKNSGNEGYYRNLLKGEKMGTVNFQIPIYLVAAREYLTGRYPIKTLEGTYYLFRKARRMKSYTIECLDPFFEKDLQKRKDLEKEDRKNIFNSMATIVNAVCSGDFSICPRDCDFCEYDQVCRFVEGFPGEGGKE